MSINELRTQYRSSEGREKQGFVSPIGEVDEEQLKGIFAGSGDKAHIQQGNASVLISDCYTTSIMGCWTVQTCTYRKEDVPFC